MIARRALTKKMYKVMLIQCFCFVEVISEVSLIDGIAIDFNITPDSSLKRKVLLSYFCLFFHYLEFFQREETYPAGKSCFGRVKLFGNVIYYIIFAPDR
jgi:hypothetical protein